MIVLLLFVLSLFLSPTTTTTSLCHARHFLVYVVLYGFWAKQNITQQTNEQHGKQNNNKQNMIIKQNNIKYVFFMMIIFCIFSLSLSLFQIRTWKRWNPNPKFGDKRMKKHWDPTKSPSANLTSMGLLALPNNDIYNSNQSSTPIQKRTESTIIELFDIPESDNKPRYKSLYPLSEDDEIYMAKCMTKYVNDYSSMFRDIKINNMQYTENQLRKMGSRYILLTSTQRRVPIPECIQHLMPGTTSG